MPEVRAELSLESSNALETVDVLGTGLEDVVTNFQTSFETAITALESEIASLGSGTATEQIIADPSQAIEALAEVETAAQSAATGLADLGSEGSAALGDVASAGLDTAGGLQTLGSEGSAALSDITAAGGDTATVIEDVGSASDAATSGVTGLQAGTSGLSGAMSVAQGEGSGVVSSLEAMGIASHSTAAGVGAGAAALGAFFVAGVAAESASQRLAITFGAQAESIKQINIGGLTGNVEQLGQKVGTTNVQIDNALSRLGSWGQTAGFSGQQTNQFTQQVTALALRAVALNPSLGSVDSILSQLTRSLATGGRGAANFYLDLNRTDITQKAIEMFGGTADALTPIEKQAAGAALAVSNLGGKLGTDFTQGAGTADNQLKALGATLKNAFETQGAGLVQSMTSLLNSVLPVAEAFISVLGPALSAVASILAILGPLIPPLVAGFIAFKVVSEIASALEFLTTAFYVVQAAMIGTEAAASASAEGIVAANLAIEASAGPIGIVLAIVGVAAAAFGLFGNAADDAGTKIDDLAKTSDAGFTKLAAKLVDFQNEAKKSGVAIQTAMANDATKNALSDLADLADKNTAAAQRYGKALLDAGAITKNQYNKAIQEGIATQKDSADAAQQNADAVSRLSAADQAAIFTTTASAAAAKTKDSVYSASISTYNALIAAGHEAGAATQQEAIAYAAASQAAKDYKTAQDILNSSTLSLASAQQQSEASVQSLAAAVNAGATDFDVHTAAGNKNFSMLIQATQGAESYATALVAAGHSQQEANASLQGFTGAIIGMLSQANVAPPVIGAMLTQLGLAPNVIDPAARSLYGLTPAVGAATGAISTLGPATAQATSASAEDIAAWAAYGVTVIPQTGQDAATGYKAGIDQMPGATGGALGSVNLTIGGWNVQTLMSDMGYNAGFNFLNSLGIALRNQDSINYVTGGVDIVAGAIRAHLQIRSPSKVFMEMGALSAQGYVEGLAGGLVGGADHVVAAAEAITRAAVATPASPGLATAGISPGSGPSQTNNFYGYSPQETAAVNGREWTRMTRFAGV